MNLALVHLSITQGLLDRIHGVSEQISAQFLKTSTSDVGVEIDAIKQGVNFDAEIVGIDEERSSRCKCMLDVKMLTWLE